MNRSPIKDTLLWLLVLPVLLSITLELKATAESLDETCVVSILNRTANVQPDGGWQIFNVPANFDKHRVRATCVRDGLTLSGQSDFITFEPNLTNGFTPFGLGSVDPIPESLALTSPTLTLNSPGQTLQINVIANFSDNSTTDVTTADTGTNYTISNANIATLSPDGLITAVSSGTVLISASNEGALGLLQIRVTLSGDADNDGLSDDIEIANGLDPNNPVDALEDFDSDGLTNKQELIDFGTQIQVADTDGDGIEDGEEVVAGTDGFITNPLLVDTDGDGIRDALEIATNSDPTDASSFNLADTLTAIEITPLTAVITVNTIIGQASHQFEVIGRLIDGTDIDLTPATKGTNFNSSDLLICNFGGINGLVFASNNGSCTLTASNAGFSDSASIIVQTFAPIAFSFINIPGVSNNIDVSGDYAYIAAGNAGLQVVDVSDRSNPQIVASVDTAGSATDIRIVSDIAYLADGNNGLVIIDIADPLNPELLASIDTSGYAHDVFIHNNHAFIADGTAGLQIIDITNPLAPVLINSINTPGNAVGVAVNDNLAIIADGTVGIQVINISDLSSASIIASIDTGNARDVELQDNFALIADIENSLTSVDLSVPNSPVIRSTTPRDNGGLLNDLALSAGFAFGADIFFVNGVPITDVSLPEALIPRQILDFSNFRDDNGTGIAVDSSHVYLTASKNGDTRLYIGQYLSLTDNAGIAPEISIVSPSDGDTVIEGSTLPITATASDDVAVAAVNFYLDNEKIATDTSEPYQTSVIVPDNTGSVSIEAEAVDLAGNNTNVEVILTVIPDPLMAAVGTAVQLDGTPIADVEVICHDISVFTGNDGRFTIPGLPTIIGAIPCTATITNSIGEMLTESFIATATPGFEVVFDFMPDPLMTAVGIIVQLNGNPIANAQVNCRGNTDITGADGRFSIPGVPTIGDITCRVSVTNAIGTTVGRSFLATPAPGIEVVLDFDQLLIAVGIVTQLDSTPIERAKITCLNKFVVTEADGRFSIPDLPTISGEISCFVEIVNSIHQSISQNFIATAAPGTVIVFDYIPDPLTTAVGTVLHEDGTAANNADVRCRDEFFFSKFFLTGVDGRFSISGVPSIGGDITCTVSVNEANGQEMTGLATASPVPAGVTDFGDIIADQEPILQE